MRPFLISLLVILSALSLAQTPEATVQQFADAISKRDLDSAAKLVVGGKVPSELVAVAKAEKDWPTLIISGLTSKIQGSEATVSYKISPIGRTDVGDQQESITLTLRGTEWLIVAGSEEPKGNAVIPMLAYMFTHPQVFANAKKAARSTVCLSNMKQVALACIMFAGDMDDVFKFTPQNWTSKILPYIRNKEILTCSEDKKGVMSYSLNPKMASKNFGKLKNPASTVLAYEGKNGHLNFRHNGRATVAFADGHVKLINAQQAKALNWNP